MISREKRVIMFNETIGEMLQELSNLFVNNGTLKMANTTYNMLVSDESELMFNVLQSKLTDSIRKDIQMRNEETLLNYKFETAIGKTIKELWTSMNQENKEVMWQYFNLISKICI